MVITSKNPATGEVYLLDRDETTPDEVRSLVDIASDCAHDYARRPLHWRANLLDAMATELESDGETLVNIAARETALSVSRLQGELQRTTYQLRFFAKLVSEGSFLGVSVDHQSDTPMGPLPDLRRLRIPLGPIGIFGSSNFPFAFSVPGGDTASGLAAGCPVIVKAHPAHPLTSQACFDALSRACDHMNAPAGLLSVVFGLHAGEALVDDPGITAVGFTGSVTGGRLLWERANARRTPIPFYGELGSANPLVVTAAAASQDGVDIGKGLANSITLGAGQFCTKPGLIFIPDNPAGNLVISTLLEALNQLEPMTMLTSEIAGHFRDNIRRILNLSDCREISYRIDQESERAGLVSARLFETTAKKFAGDSSAVLRDECFGPSALVIRFDNRVDLLEALETIDAALTFTVFLSANDDNGWLVEYGSSRAGRVVVNGYPTGVGVSWSMQHGGPWPSTTISWATSVGADAVMRWLRPVAYQNVPESLLPLALRDDTPLQIPRRIDGIWHP